MTMSRASPAVSDVYSEESSQYTHYTEDSDVTYRSGQRTTISGQSMCTKSTKESLGSAGTSYWTTETTKTEQQNRSWFDNFWAWYLKDDKGDENRVEERQDEDVKEHDDEHSAQSDGDSVGSLRSNTSHLISVDGKARENTPVMFEHENMKLRRDGQAWQKQPVCQPSDDSVEDDGNEDDSSVAALTHDSDAARRSRRFPRPLTPRYVRQEHREPVVEPNESAPPSPNSRTPEVTVPRSKYLNIQGRNNEMVEDRSMSIIQAKEKSRNKRELPPRPKSAITFGARPRPIATSKNFEEIEMKRHDGRNSTMSTLRLRPPTPHKDKQLDLQVQEADFKGSTIKVTNPSSKTGTLDKKVDLPTTLHGNANGTLNNGKKMTISTSKLAMNIERENFSIPILNAKTEQPESSPSTLNQKIDKERFVPQKCPRGTQNPGSILRSLGARKRFGTPVFCRAASFDGVLTHDASQDEAPIEQRKISISTKDALPVREVLPVRINSPMELREPVQEKKPSHFSGSAAVFLSLFSPSDDKPSIEAGSRTKEQQGTMKTVRSTDQYENLSGHLNEGMQPKTWDRSKQSPLKRPGGRGKVILTQLKAHRSFS